jgi:hypothetical protein
LFVVLLVIAPSSQELEPPTNPARFTIVGREAVEQSADTLPGSFVRPLGGGAEPVLELGEDLCSIGLRSGL